ncbi:MAG: cytochrome C [Bacteroidetes bacterium]|nr:cytochrome C [Bacteroidota bacterium]
MKLKNLFFAVTLVLAFTQMSFAQTIVGSAHDFSSQAWNTTGEICIVCHTPHGAITTVSNAPLWNHQVTATAAFTLYSGSTFNGASTITQPDASSKLCLSCHDGTVALQNFSGTTGAGTTISSFYNVGTNLANDHPISFDYNAALVAADGGGLKDPTTALGIGTQTIQNSMLFSNKMQCASCHDVHNSAGIAFLLLKSNAASALCLTCHNK